jgi:hypothetical protein
MQASPSHTSPPDDSASDYLRAPPAPVQAVFERLAIVLESLSDVAARLERLGVAESAVADVRYVERAQDIDRIVQGLHDTSRFVRVLSDVRPRADTIELGAALKVVGQAALARQFAGELVEDADPGDFEMF